MSDAILRSVDAMDIEAAAAEWLERRDRDDWSEADQAALNTWLEQPANRLAYLRLYSAWNYADRLAALRRPEGEQIAPAPRKPMWPMFLRIAAAFAFIVIVGAAAARFLTPPPDRVFTTVVGGRELVSFADGSKIELNTDTVLRTRMTTNKRLVWLDKGEAYFQVKHDPAHPFIVMIGDRRVTDLGTDFFIRRDDARLEVAVVRGSVRFDAQRQTAMLAPGDVVTAMGDAMLRAKKTERELIDKLGWRRGVLVFSNTRLADAAEEFNRYNREKLIVTDPAAARLTIGGTFPANDVSAFTDVAQDVLGLRVETHGDEIVISH
jgi:transmembrane sensor